MKMQHFLVFALCVASVLAKYCIDISIHDIGECCKEHAHKIEPSDEVKKCLQLPGYPLSCERDICISSKKGFGTDGNVDIEALEKIITNSKGYTPEENDRVMKNCVHGDLAKYSPPDACEISKVMACFRVHFLAACREWNTDDHCTEVKELVDKCVEL